MPGPEKLELSDAVLLRYLLGALPVDEAEPIEEASIVDDDLAARLNVIERDLVDSYVRGELEARNLARFQSWYLSSPLRAEKVAAARAILRIADGVIEAVPALAATSAPIAPEVCENATANSVPTGKAAPTFAPTLSYGRQSAARKSLGWRFGKLTAWPILGLAAVLILIVAVGFLSSKNRQLRNEVAETKKETSALTAQLDDKHVGESSTAAGKGGAPGALAHSGENIATVTMFLPAPTRGASTIRKVDVPAGTGLVVLSLGLGSTDEETYRAQLLNPATNKVVWRSGLLRPGTDGTYVSVAVPGTVLRSQIYVVQLLHDGANGAPELLGSYPFRVEVK
jgi:anti-sigma factor RsiW